MSILVLGASGMQGRAAVYDLITTPPAVDVIAADLQTGEIRRLLATWGRAEAAEVRSLDARDAAAVLRLMGAAEVVIDLLPSSFALDMVRHAVDAGVHLVNTGYVVDPASLSASGSKATLAALDRRARAAEVTILRECGFDPGLDLLLVGRAARELDTIEELRSYGSGFPERAAADNPLRYKITWSLDGVLKAYRRGGRYIDGGRVHEFKADEMFAPEHTHVRHFDGFGQLESYPNGDSVALAERLDIAGRAQTVGRFVSRWPGHAPFWYRLVRLGFLDAEPIQVDGRPVEPRAFLTALLEPQLRLEAGERDVTFIHAELVGSKGESRRRLIYRMVDHADLERGFTAMQRTVGFTASIAAQLILAGTITGRGVLSPLGDVPYDPFVAQLEDRGIRIERSEQEIA